ncbi:hypothetical protein NVP2275O_029 [Vibrio phage 2.275.O._10N.286.54.E11]|nr:hypothetical protein NVP2275O_029 [Vibrio phage 2.275.O._10N.286.54.E11]
MADKEIGLIQIRNGKQRNLPTALEHAELALTTDEGRMFIGLPATVTPASLVAGRRKNASSGSNYIVQGSGEENIELITEFTPQHVLDRVLYKAQRFSISQNSSILLQIPYTNRLFLEYVAFPDTLDLLESGQSQVAVFNNPKFDQDDPGAFPEFVFLVDQQNNSNDEDGVPTISINPDTVALTGTTLTIEILNDGNQDVNFEYVTRGWGAV